LARAVKRAVRIASVETAKAARAEARRLEIIAKPWLAPGLSLNERRRLRYQHDATFNVAERVRIQMRSRRRFRNMEHILRKAVAGKVTTPSIEKFIGYTMSDLHQHLEAKFDDFMDWSAFCEGLIHIDHIRPVISFNLDDPEQVRACWALSNLQPLWHGDNLRKSRRYDGEKGKGKSCKRQGAEIASLTPSVCNADVGVGRLHAASSSPA